MILAQAAEAVSSLAGLRRNASPGNNSEDDSAGTGVAAPHTLDLGSLADAAAAEAPTPRGPKRKRSGDLQVPPTGVSTSLVL